jgi:peptide/nickel transport system substrate-binding protein
VVFVNSVLGDRKRAMELCSEQEGQLDIVTHIRPLDTLKLAQSPYAKVLKSRDSTILFGFINQRKSNSKWRDIRLRRAINYAINREELLKFAAKGNAYNLGGAIPPGTFGYNPDLPLYSYNTAKAKSLLAKAGYAAGFEMKIITSEPWILEAQIIGRMLERVGIEAMVEVFTFSDHLERIYMPLLRKSPEEQDWDVSINFLTDWFNHPILSLLSYGFLEDTQHRWIPYDPVYENMFKLMTRTIDDAKQEEIVRKMERYVYDGAYGLFIYSPLALYAVNKEIKFIPYENGSLNLKETSVTENHWSLRGKNN